MSVAAATVENSMEGPKKVKNKAAAGSSTFTSENVSKGNEKAIFTRYPQRPLFTAALFPVTALQEQPKCPPTGKQIETRCAHAAAENSAARAEEILSFATTRMDPWALC